MKLFITATRAAITGLSLGLLSSCAELAELEKNLTGKTPQLTPRVLPAVTPNLSLIVGVMFSDLRSKAIKGESVDSFMYRLALWLSLVYLLLLFITPLLSPFAEVPLDTYLQNSKLPLSLAQALATTALGAFYVQRESKS